jgi:hypothetical protein
MRDGSGDICLSVDDNRLVGGIDAIGGDKNSTVLDLAVRAFGYDGRSKSVNGSQ